MLCWRQAEVLLAAGAQAYLTKPLQIGRFLDAVDAALGCRPHPEPATAEPAAGQ
jgi:DNA-binding response OmpR family regulator